MTEKLIPLLRNIKTKEPSVTLAALSVYAEMGKRLGHDVIASDILPALWPMATGVLLNMEQVISYFGLTDLQFNQLLGVIRELEEKVIQQQTQKLQELGPASVSSKAPISTTQANASLGPMEETTLDFESLVLGKKPAIVNNLTSTSPPITSIQPVQSLHTSQRFSNSGPTTPMGLMSPMQPTTSQTPPPLSSSTILQPLKPSPYTAPTSTPMRLQTLQSAPLGPHNGLFTSPSTTYNVPPPTYPDSAFGANPWALDSLPTIAPPPAKPSIGSTPQQKSSGNSGLEKYQSLL
jgi:SCY1-like protein 2